MNSIKTIAVHELKTMYRRRLFQIVTVGIPTVLLVAIVVIWAVQNLFEGDEETKKAGFVDGSGLLEDHLTQGSVTFVPYPTREDGMDALLAEEIENLFIIPDEYLATGVVERVKVKVGFDLDGGGNEPALRAFVLANLLALVPSSDLTARLTEPVLLASVAVDREGEPQETNEPRVLFFMALTFLLFMSLAFTGGLLLQGLGEEKENRIMEVLVSSVTAGELLVGKILGLGAAGLTQVMLWAVSGGIMLAVLPSITDLEVPLPGVGPMLLALLFFVLGYLMFATLMAGVGAIAPTTRESQQLSIVIVLPMIIPIYASPFIVENPTAPFVRFLTFFPLSSTLVVLQRVGPGSIEWWEVAGSLVVLVASICAAMFLVARVFRAYLLSYGKRPSIRQLWLSLVRA